MSLADDGVVGAQQALATADVSSDSGLDTGAVDDAIREIRRRSATATGG